MGLDEVQVATIPSLKKKKAYSRTWHTHELSPDKDFPWQKKSESLAEKGMASLKKQELDKSSFTKS